MTKPATNLPGKKPKFKILPLRSLFPNLITLASLCAGMASIKSALSSHWQESVALILLAAFLDGMDGRIARYLKATSNFGAQLDSLADFLNFGVAPAFILYLWKLQFIKSSSFGWAVALFFTVCMSLRLARFNTELEDENLPSWSDKFFVGIPAPVAACLSLVPIMLQLQFDVDLEGKYIAIFSFIIALLMVSRVPTFSIKKITIRREFIYIATILSSLMITFLLIKPWTTIIFLSFLYLISIFFSIMYYLRLKNSDASKSN